MPCMCWYDPPEESKRLIKDCCEKIVAEMHKLDKEGDAYGCTLHEVKELIEHLYRPDTCKEKR